MKAILWLFWGSVLAMIAGCTTSPSTGGGTGGTVLIGDVPEISIPSYNESAPQGILEQLAWAGTGGHNDPRGNCNGCSTGWKGDTLFLQNFEPNQELLLFFYRSSGSDSCGNSTADFATGYGVLVNDKGFLELKVSGMDSDIFLYEIYDANNGVLQLGMTLGGKYPC
jgi:hypothetical protein